MTSITVYDVLHKPDHVTQSQIVEFLFEQLGEYGDPKDQIRKAMAYALKEVESFGGLVLVMRKQEAMVGASIVLRTGMSEYIPENILVYIAISEGSRGMGYGTKLMRTAIEKSPGDFALHCEKDNPAKKLYEKLGFTNPYLEMRLKR